MVQIGPPASDISPRLVATRHLDEVLGLAVAGKVGPGIIDAVAVAIEDRIAVDLGFDLIEMSVLVPVFACIQDVVVIQIFGPLDRHIPDLEEPCPDFNPGVDVRVAEGQHQQETHHHDDLDRHDELQGVVNLAAEDQRDEAHQEDEVRQVLQQSLVAGKLTGIGDSLQIQRRTGGRGTRGEVRENRTDVQ